MTGHPDPSCASILDPQPARRQIGLPEEVGAVVLAGGSASRQFAEKSGLQPGQSRALARIGSITMAEAILQALRSCPSVESVTLAAAAAPYFPGKWDYTASSGDGLMGTITAGVEAGSREPWVLLITGDLPFVTPEAIESFILDAFAEPADFYYGAVRRRDYAAAFPELKRTWLHTPSGDYTGANLALLHREAVVKLRKIADAAYSRRKNPLQLVQLVGVRRFFKLIARQLELSDIETAVSSILQLRCRFVVTPHACLAADIDRPDDWPAAVKRWEKGLTS